MTPTALLTLSGTVAAVRTVTIPAREATDTSPKGYPGGTYEECVVQSPDALLLGEQVDGVNAYVAVRFTSDDPGHLGALAQLVPGAVVTLAVVPFVDTFRIRGRWGNAVGYRFGALRAVRTLAAVSAG